MIKRILNTHKPENFTETPSVMFRMLKLQKAIKSFKISSNKDEMNEIENDIWSTRGCFQTTSSESAKTSMEDKIKLLQNLKTEKNLDTLQLAIRVMDIGTKDFNKDIAELDLILGMSEIIDYLLEENKS